MIRTRSGTAWAQGNRDPDSSIPPYILESSRRQGARRHGLVMQRINDKDLSAHVLANDEGYTQLKLEPRQPRQKSSHLPSRAELTRHAREILWPERESPRLETAVISRFAYRRHSAKGDLTGRLRQAIECASGFADVPGGHDTAAEQCPLGRPIYRIDDTFPEGHSRRRRSKRRKP
jgi:hypothetical protein